jgi:hypothetical protein
MLLGMMMALTLSNRRSAYDFNTRKKVYYAEVELSVGATFASICTDSTQYPFIEELDSLTKPRVIPHDQGHWVAVPRLRRMFI